MFISRNGRGDRGRFIIIVRYCFRLSITTSFPEYFLGIYTPRTFVPKSPPVNMDMNTSKRRIDISEHSDDGSEHAEAAIGDGVQDDIAKDISPGPTQHVDSNPQPKAKAHLQFLKGIANYAESITTIATAVFAVFITTCAIVIMVTEMIALYRGAPDLKMMMSILVMTFITGLVESRRKEGECGCG